MKSTKIMGLGITACVAACAASIATPLFLSASAIGIGGISMAAVLAELELAMILAVAIGLGGLALYWRRHQFRKLANQCASDGICGCQAKQTND